MQITQELLHGYEGLECDTQVDSRGQFEEPACTAPKGKAAPGRFILSFCWRGKVGEVTIGKYVTKVLNRVCLSNVVMYPVQRFVLLLVRHLGC